MRTAEISHTLYTVRSMGTTEILEISGNFEMEDKWQFFIFLFMSFLGNLYSHMRKHTGQYYRCIKCKFKTVNKSHLLEHEMTHSGIRHLCEICKKDYNTQKSLMNHVRKYHTSKKGEF